MFHCSKKRYITLGWEGEDTDCLQTDNIPYQYNTLLYSGNSPSPSIHIAVHNQDHRDLQGTPGVDKQ